MGSASLIQAFSALISSGLLPSVVTPLSSIVPVHPASTTPRASAVRPTIAILPEVPSGVTPEHLARPGVSACWGLSGRRMRQEEPHDLFAPHERVRQFARDRVLRRVGVHRAAGDAVD